MTSACVKLVFYAIAVSLRVGLASATDRPSPCVDNRKAISQVSNDEFADENTSLLALKLSSGLTADRLIYNRLMRDLRRIRSRKPAVARVKYRPSDDNMLSIKLTPESAARYNNGEYSEWTCLNSVIGVYAKRSVTDQLIHLVVGGSYNLALVAKWYRELPGVEFAGPSQLVGDGSNIYVVRDGSNWRYLFDVASVDCIAVCSHHEMYLFQLAGDGRISAIRSYRTNSKNPAPNWVSETFQNYR